MSRNGGNDEAKRLFPEFNKGWGAGVVHEESQMIEKSVYLDALNKNKGYIVNYSMITTCLPVDGDISGELDIIRGTVTVLV